MNPLNVKITEHAVLSDGRQGLSVFQVHVENEDGVWDETIADRQSLDWFLRGLRCAGGFFNVCVAFHQTAGKAIDLRPSALIAPPEPGADQNMLWFHWAVDKPMVHAWLDCNQFLLAFTKVPDPNPGLILMPIDTRTADRRFRGIDIRVDCPTSGGNPNDMLVKVASPARIVRLR